MTQESSPVLLMFIMRSPHASGVRGCAATAGGSPQEKKRAHLLDTYWGRPVPGFGDPERATADRRACAGGARREPHRTRVHRRRRRRVGRLPHVGAARSRVRQHRRHHTYIRRWAEADGCVHSRRCAVCAARQQASAGGDYALSGSSRCGDRAPSTHAASSWPSARSHSTPGSSCCRRRGVAGLPGHSSRTAQIVVDGRHGADAHRLLSPEPAEHEHREADSRR